MMKKYLAALAGVGLISTPALADSNLKVYGTLDMGLQKATASPLALERGDNNRLGLRGSEDLGDGVKALFRLEMRFELDTGTTESLSRRPLFQGSSWAGLSGDFGTIRLGRDMTAMQYPIGDYDPFNMQTVGSIDATVGNFSTDPSYAGSSGNRLSNGVFYSSPVVGNFQFNANIGTKEGLNGSAPLSSNCYSLSVTYNGELLQTMAGAERSVAGDKFWNVSAAYTLGHARLISSYSRLKRLVGPAETNWLLGGDIAVGAGSVKMGYGQIKPENAAADRQVSLGYWHNLSRRTMIYTDISNHTPAIGEAIRIIDFGINHTF